MGVQSRQCLRNSWVRLGITAVIALSAFGQPQRHQQYSQKLAPFVPSPQKVVDRMLAMANPRATETVFDLGCGDGRVLITAAQRYNAKAVGVEMDERLVERANTQIVQLSLQDRVKIVHGDLLQADLTGADVVVLYLMTGSNELLRPRLERFLKPGARVVSYSYRIPGWKPSRVDKTDERNSREIYLYEMPPAKQ